MKCKNLFQIIVMVAIMILATNVAFAQSRVVIDQSSNAVAFTKDNKSWGLEISGKKVLGEQYKSVGFQNGLFKLENTAGQWNVCDKTGTLKLSNWIKAKDVKITDAFVLFEEAAGKMAIIYDRATWQPVKAKATTYDAMHDEVVEANRHKGTSIHNYEGVGERNNRIYRTIPRRVPAKSAGGKAFIKRGEKEIVSWTGTGEWLKPHKSYYGGPGREYPYLGEDSSYRDKPTELYFLAHDTEKNCAYVIWVLADGSDKINTTINGEKNGYVKITPHPLHPTRLMMCQTADGVEHPVWVWGQPLINNLVPHESYNNGAATKKREEIAKSHVNCSHCIQQSKLYGEKK